MLGHPSKPGCTSPGRGVRWGGSRQEGLRLLGPLTLEEWGCGEGAALAGDLSPGGAFEKFQMEEVSEQPAVQDPTPDTHTWVSTSQNTCLVRPPVLEACTPARGWGPGAGLALCCPHPCTLWCLCSPGRRCGREWSPGEPASLRRKPGPGSSAGSRLAGACLSMVCC